MYVAFRQLNSEFLRSKTFAKTMVSEESFIESVSECTELKHPWTIKTIWADMLLAHSVSATHYQQRATSSPTLIHSNTVQICMSQDLPTRGLLRAMFEGRISFETASTTMVFCKSAFSVSDFSAFISQFTDAHEMQVNSIAQM